MKKKKLTKQDILEMFAASDARFAKQMAESNAKFEQQMAESNAEADKRNVEADKRNVEADKRNAELDKKFQETDIKIQALFQETNKKFQETDAKIDKMVKLYGSVADNSRDFSEEFFYRALLQRSSLCGIAYEEVDRMERRTKKLQGEYDLVLHNGDTIIVIEVKYKLHPNDVQDFYDRKFPNFRKLFPEYNEKKLVGGVAGLTIPTESIELAEKFGFIVLCNSGENAAVANIEAENFIPKRF